MKLYLGNDNVLTLDGLQNGITEAYLNAATVSVTLVDADDAEVTGETWPLTMSYVAASNGVYRATLTDTLSGISAGDIVTAQVSANGGAGLQGYWEIPLTVAVRAT